MLHTDEKRPIAIASLRKCLEAFFPFFTELKKVGSRRVIVCTTWIIDVDLIETPDSTPEELMSRILLDC
jgi:hypothetical protein